MYAWKENGVTTSEENLQSATDWLWAFKPEESCQMNTASALLKATEDVVGPFIFPIFDLDFRKFEHCNTILDHFWIIRHENFSDQQP